MHSYTLKTPATETILTLDEAKKQIKMEDEDVDNDIIEAALRAAEQMAMDKTSRAFMRATYEYVSDGWGCNYEIVLWPAPLVEVVSVKYYDENNELQTLATDQYQVNTRNLPGRIYLKTTPSLYDRFDAVIIEYKVGYGVSATTDADVRAFVPEPVKSWVKLNLATLYENRQVLTEARFGNIETYSDKLIFPYTL